jgi:hypothetical protein
MNGCISGCNNNPTLPMCRVCVQALGAPYGASLNQYRESITRYERTVASPHGTRGSVRQKFQNKTWKHMRVKPVRMGYNWALLRIKQIHGESRWEEAEIISMLREQNALILGRGQRLVWHGEKSPARFVKHVWRKKHRNSRKRR